MLSRAIYKHEDVCFRLTSQTAISSHQITSLSFPLPDGGAGSGGTGGGVPSRDGAVAADEPKLGRRIQLPDFRLSGGGADTPSPANDVRRALGDPGLEPPVRVGDGRGGSTPPWPPSACVSRNSTHICENDYTPVSHEERGPEHANSPPSHRFGQGHRLCCPWTWSVICHPRHVAVQLSLARCRTRTVCQRES
jgi:hypothetical protein